MSGQGKAWLRCCLHGGGWRSGALHARIAPALRAQQSTTVSSSAPDTRERLKLQLFLAGSCPLPAHLPLPSAAPDTDKMIELQLFLDVQEFGRQAKQVRYQDQAKCRTSPKGGTLGTHWPRRLLRAVWGCPWVWAPGQSINLPGSGKSACLLLPPLPP